MVDYLEGAVRPTTDECAVRPVHDYGQRPPIPPVQRRPSFVLLSADTHFIKVRKRFVLASVFVVAVPLAWYFTYLCLSVYAQGFMGTPIHGSINVALLMGIGQFVSTFVLAWGYCTYARRRIDPHAATLCEHEAEAEIIRNGRVVRE